MGRLNKWCLFEQSIKGYVFGCILSMCKILQQFSMSRDEREKYDELNMWQLRL